MGNKSSKKKMRKNKQMRTDESVEDEYDYTAMAYSDPTVLHTKSPDFPAVAATVTAARRMNKQKNVAGVDDETSPGATTPPLPAGLVLSKSGNVTMDGRKGGHAASPNIATDQVVQDEYGSPVENIFTTEEEDPELVMASRFTMFELPPGLSSHIESMPSSPQLSGGGRFVKGLSKMVDRTSHMLETIRNNQEGMNTSISENSTDSRHGPPRVLQIKSTLNVQDLAETLKAVSYAIFYHLVAGESTKIKTFVSELSELQHVTPDPVKGPPPTQRPTAGDIAKYLEHMFKNAQLSPETAVVVVVYVERLLAIAGVTLDRTNWRRTILICTLLAAKAWEDEAVWNVDFVQLFPTLEVKDVNRLEMKMLELLQYSITVKASQYARYYFELRHLMETKDYKFSLDNASEERLAMLEQRSLKHQQLQIKRSIVDFDLIAAQAMAEVDEEVHEEGERKKVTDYVI